MAKAKAKITKIGGKFRIDMTDSRGQRTRPSFSTKAEALAALTHFEANKESGKFVVTRNATFGQALDLLLLRNEREGLAKSSQKRAASIIEAHLRPVFGARKLADFVAQRMRFVQEWLDDRARNDGAAAQSLVHTISYIKMAFDQAISAGLMPSPNPVTEFGVRAPQLVKRQEREVLRLEEISKLVSSALRRDHGEHELTWCTRFMIVLIGLLAGLRNQECSGLHWDCVDLDGRMIYVRRSWRQGEGIVPVTKTGKSGYRNIPMSPVLDAAFRSYAHRLKVLGRPVEGPVLMASRTDIVLPLAITSHHWPTVAGKAGFIDKNGGLQHTYYALRHTAANLWRTVGIQPDRLMTLMGHTSYQTTVSNYLHETPHFEVLRREVESFGLERNPAGLIDGLGIALARRWRDDGIEIGCAEPRSGTPLIGVSDPKTINLVPMLAIPSASSETGSAPAVNSLEQLRARQLARCQELYALGWTKPRIGAELGLCRSTIADMIRTNDQVRWLRKLPTTERKALMARCAQLRDERPQASSTEIAKELGINPAIVVRWEKKRGKPMPHRPGAHKLGKHESRIRKMFAAGFTTKQMARELDGPSRSAIAYFINRLGLRTGATDVQDSPVK